MNNRIVNAFYTIIAATTFIMGAGITSRAFAAESASKLPSETVSYADLNLSSPEGVASLQRRIHASAQRVCRSYDDSDPFSSLVVQACERRAESDALAKVKGVQLSRSEQAKPGEPPLAAAFAVHGP